MTPEQALHTIRECGKWNLFKINPGVLSSKEAKKRRLTVQDIRSALSYASECEPDANLGEMWKVTGPDLSGKPLTLRVITVRDVAVIKVF